MEAKELMINDLVSLRGRMSRVIKTTDVFATIIDERGNKFAPEEVDGVSITEMMLHRNGFVITGDKAEYKPFGELKLRLKIRPPYDVTRQLVIDGVGEYGHVINYVHELQHLLRLIGLSNVADNFRL